MGRVQALRGLVSAQTPRPDCGGAELDEGPVTITHDFGQFITLQVPGAGGQKLDTILHAGLGDQLTVQELPSKLAGILAGKFGGVPLLDLVNGDGEIHLRAFDEATYTRKTPVNPFGDAKGSAQIVEGGATHRFTFELDEVTRSQLAAGRSATVIASRSTPDGGRRSILLNIEPEVAEIALDEDAVAEVLSSRRVRVADGDVTVELADGQIEALIADRPTMAKTTGDPPRLLKLAPPSSAPEVALASEDFQIVDLPGFLADPFVLDDSGSPLSISLTGGEVKELLKGRAEVVVAGRRVAIHRESSGPALPLTRNGALPPIAGGAAVKKPMLEIGEIPWAPKGKALAVDAWEIIAPQEIPRELPPVVVSLFLPWVQTWTLAKIEEGRELKSFTLIPGQELTIETFTWDRSKKSLDRTSQMDSTQTFEMSSSSKDTDDVVREMATNNEFQLNGQAGLSATVKGGYAEVTANGQVSGGTKTAIANTAKGTTQNLTEQASKAAVTVSSRRVSHITESREFGSEERTTHRIRNPNMCHDLTFTYHEVMAAYRVETTLRKDRAQLVALIENPLSIAFIDGPLVRRNETAFRNSLLDPALTDGFDALRMLASYEAAQEIIRKQAAVLAAQAAAAAEKTEQDRLAAQAAQAALASAQTGSNSSASGTGTDLAEGADPLPTAEELAVAAVFDKVIAAAKSAIQDGQAKANQVMRTFALWRKPSESDLRAVRRYIFWTMLQATSSSLTSTLEDQAKVTFDAKSKPKLEAAVSILACAPENDIPGLGGLIGLPDAEKEKLAISTMIRRSGEFKAEGDWAWWSGTCRDHGLYSPDDCGLPTLLKDLREAMRKFNEAKTRSAATAGFGTPKEAIESANKSQDKSEAVDRLDQAFSLVDLANASERADALLAHMADHRDYYRYALFQALPPSEQLQRIIDSTGGNLPVGLFEPRVIAMNGSQLAVPLARGVSVKLDAWFNELIADVPDPPPAIAATPPADGTGPDAGDGPLTRLPTPGLRVKMRLGRCSGCEDFIEESRRIDLIEREAKALQSLAEAARRTDRIVSGDLGDPLHPADGITLRLDDARQALVPAGAPAPTTPPGTQPAPAPTGGAAGGTPPPG
ncbi:hypothetical protein [Miltoncostaea oceani]|uniref:hypothetical protein n=1 Tax=Miltoncostaea oceani TaxID=2843216 RepID=UPI001C3D832B|nr:hypothetical protein [Miltoncostaea oceani]